MTARTGALRVVLLCHPDGSPGGGQAEGLVEALAADMRAAGHFPHVLASRQAANGTALPEALLRRRGFAAGLTRLPLTLLALARGRYDVTHAFSAPDAIAGLLWRRLSGVPAVFTCVETLRRERLSDRRLRLWSLARAVEGCDAVIAPSEESRAALSRWLAVDAPLMDPRDAVAHERLYRELVGRRR